jgi:branched-chain amino acid transport system permease protein
MDKQLVTRLVHNTPTRYRQLLLFAFIMALLPIAVRSSYLLSILVFVGIYTILTLGLCLLMGYAGQVSLGHAAFYGIGAYSSAILTSRYNLNPWLGIVCAMAITGGIAAFLAKPIFRLRGHLLAMATLGLGYIISTFFNEATAFTGGPSGLTGIPYLSIGGFAFNRDIEYYYLVWGVVALTMFVALSIVHSRIGRALRAIHSSDIATRAMGANTSQLKAQIFVLSAATAGLAGSLYAHYVLFVNPSPFGGQTTQMLLVMAAVGGMSTVWGAPFGAALVTVLTEALRAIVPKITNGATGEYEIIVFGLLLLYIMLRVPQGLVQGLGEVLARWRKDVPAKGRRKVPGLLALRQLIGIGGREGTS